MVLPLAHLAMLLPPQQIQALGFMLIHGLEMDLAPSIQTQQHCQLQQIMRLRFLQVEMQLRLLLVLVLIFMFTLGQLVVLGQSILIQQLCLWSQAMEFALIQAAQRLQSQTINQQTQAVCLFMLGLVLDLVLNTPIHL